MRNIKYAFILGLLSFASTVVGAESILPAPPSGTFEFTGVEFGQTNPYARIHVDVVGINRSSDPIQVDRVLPREPDGVAVKFKAVTVNVGGKFNVSVEATLDSETGRIARYFDVYAKGKNEPIDGFVIRGYADWLVLPSVADIDFGIFEPSTRAEKVIDVETRPGVQVRLVGVDKPSAYVDAQVTADGKALRLTSRSDAPWSSFDEKLLVTTDNALQPKVAFHLRGQSRGFVVPASDPLDFGLLREGQSAELTDVLTDVTGKPLNVGKIVAKSRASVITEVTDCAVPSPSCKNLKVRYPPMNMRGVTGGTLEVELPDYDRTLFIRFGAIGIGKDTQIRDLAEDMKAREVQPESISSVLQTSVAHPKAKAQPTQMKTPEGTGPLLKWQVANEYDIYGYEIYRSDSENGNFHRISDKIIERLEGDPEVGSSYQWRDNTAAAGKTYWYYINIVFNKGKKQKFTSPQKVVAK